MLDTAFFLSCIMLRPTTTRDRTFSSFSIFIICALHLSSSHLTSLCIELTFIHLTVTSSWCSGLHRAHASGLGSIPGMGVTFLFFHWCPLTWLLLLPFWSFRSLIAQWSSPLFTGHIFSSHLLVSNPVHSISSIVSFIRLLPTPSTPPSALATHSGGEVSPQKPTLPRG